jgi:hypothetical protein
VNPRLFQKVVSESVGNGPECSWHFHVPQHQEQHQHSLGNHEIIDDDGNGDIDIGDEDYPASWVQGEVEDMYPEEPETQVLGKRRTLEDAEIVMDDQHNPQKRQNISS